MRSFAMCSPIGLITTFFVVPVNFSPSGVFVLPVKLFENDKGLHTAAAVPEQFD